MSLETPLDHAHAAMEAAPEDSTARLRFYDRLSETELYLMLAREAEGDQAEPELFDLGDARFVLVFDTEDRLSTFAGRAVPYAALSGRSIVGMLAGQEIGIALNPEVAPSSILLPTEAVDWLADTVAQGPSEAEARPQELRAPGGMPDGLLDAIDAKLRTATGMARRGYLAEVTYDTGVRGHLIGFTGTIPGAESALARAIQEALVFSGLEAAALDVVFLRDSDPVTAQLARVGLRFDLPEPQQVARVEPLAPGSDPDKPPILR
ncbi:SseB family protein [Marivita hallyeonensis]|uniref:SseB protein N-terminal domain-containing protein n=1 Tax=Marivita hallyeonensis TaxID=996342 RepID=A0A1M5TD79_9RHOB|nr:SseB family protein [Marivita hallyeonensis]SHH48664.1 SseB protein N-terminal domain-containing protein [Marivita hallyeonensis]